MLTLPVTPQSYAWETGRTVEVVPTEGIGDLHLPGLPALDTRTVECLLPGQHYPFNEPGAVTNPRYYLDILRRWSANGAVVRYLVAGVGLNRPVLIASVQERADDGTDDVHCTITLREYRKPTVTKTQQTATVLSSREDTVPSARQGRVVAVRSGDTLWGLCKRVYGSATLSRCKAVGRVNAIKNINLIFPGQEITFPPLDSLGA